METSENSQRIVPSNARGNIVKKHESHGKSFSVKQMYSLITASS